MIRFGNDSFFTFQGLEKVYNIFLTNAFPANYMKKASILWKLFVIPQFNEITESWVLVNNS